MKPDYADITIVLDRSGSMESVKEDTIGGFNHFLADQQKAAGTATITLVQFDNEFEVVFRAIPLKKAQKLTRETFIPRGSTALLDAVGRAIDETGARLAALAEAERPGKVVFVIVTDGHENSSHQFTGQRIDQMIGLQRNVYKWEFVFLGANQDAIASAAAMHIPASHALTYAASAEGTDRAFRAVSSHMAAWRGGDEDGLDFVEEDRECQEELLEAKEKKKPRRSNKPSGPK